MKHHGIMELPPVCMFFFHFFGLTLEVNFKIFAPIGIGCGGMVVFIEPLFSELM